MPRRATASRSLKQNTLDDFVRSSSPAIPQTSTTTKRNATSMSRGSQRKRVHSPPVHASHIPTKDDTSESSDVGDIHFEPEAISSEDEDEEASPRRPSTKKLRTRLARADSEEDDAIPASKDDVVGVGVAWKRKNTKGKRKQVTFVEDSDEEEQPQRRKLVRGLRPPSPEEEDADLLNEVDEDKIIEPRLRTRNKKSEFQRNLEKLKQKKLGKAALSVSPSSGSEEGDKPVPFAHARPSTKGASDPSDDETMDAAEEDEDTFIVDDDNAEAPELPVAFSMTTHQDLNHQFKIICQFFVHLAVHGKDDRASVMEALLEKEYFSVPLEVTRRKIIGMRDSLVTSSVWRPEFKKPLETYPVFETIRLDFAIPACDACRLGGRMSTLLGRLSGTPYDKFGFESVNESDDSDGDVSGDEDDVPRAKKEFHLGRFCAARTRVFHKFTHWEYSLFRSLLQEVDELRNTGSDGGGRFVRVAFAGGKQPPEDLSDADAIMDWLDQRGIINMEWVKIKEMMESARNLEMRAKKGEDEDD